MIPRRVTLIIPRLATNHVGELVAARDAITRALAAVGLGWTDLAEACAGGPAPTPSPSPMPAMSFADMARAARDLDAGRLTPRERKFILDVCRHGFAWQPTPKQAEWLTDIFSRLKGRAAA